MMVESGGQCVAGSDRLPRASFDARRSGGPSLRVREARSRDSQVGARGYSSSSEYVRELIRKDQDRQHLRALLLAGAASPPPVTADADYFGRLR